MIVPVVPPNSVETKRIVHRGRTSPRQCLHCARCFTSGLEGARVLQVRFVGGRFLLGPRRGDRRGSRGESQMLEDRPRRLRRMDRRENPHRSMATGTLQHVDGKHPAHQFRPTVVTGRTEIGRWRMRWRPVIHRRLLIVARRSLARGTTLSWRRSDRLTYGRHHGVPPGRSRCEYTMVANQVDARRRYQCSQLLHKFHRRENHVSRSVPPAVLQSIQQPSVRQLLEALGGDRRTRHVAAQALQTTTIVRRHAYIRMQVDAGDARASRPQRKHDILRVDTVSQSLDPLAPAGTRGHTAPHGGAVKRG